MIVLVGFQEATEGTTSLCKQPLCSPGDKALNFLYSFSPSCRSWALCSSSDKTSLVCRVMLLGTPDLSWKDSTGLSNYHFQTLRFNQDKWQRGMRLFWGELQQFQQLLMCSVSAGEIISNLSFRRKGGRRSSQVTSHSPQEKDGFNLDYFHVRVYNTDPTNGFAARKEWALKMGIFCESVGLWVQCWKVRPIMSAATWEEEQNRVSFDSQILWFKLALPD